MRDETPLLGLKNVGPDRKAARPRMATPVCYYLHSLQGALDGVQWDALSSARKDKLLKDAGMRPRRGRSRRRARKRGG